MKNVRWFASHPIHAFLDLHIQKLARVGWLKEASVNEESNIHSPSKTLVDGMIFIQSRLNIVVAELMDSADLGELYKLVQLAANIHAIEINNRSSLIDGNLKSAIKLVLTFPVDSEVKQLELIQAQRIEIDGLKEQLNVHAKNLEKKIFSLNEIYSDYNSKLENQLSYAAEKLESILSTTHKSTEDARKTLKNKLKDFEDLFFKELNETTKSASEQFDSLYAITQGLVAKIQEYNDESAELIRATSGNVHSHSYAAVSFNENRTACYFRWAAIITMFTAALFLIFLTLTSFNTSGTIDWKIVLYKIPVAIFLFAPAAYLASEASKHQKIAAENKRIEIELLTLSNFIHPLGDERADSVKDRLADKYFVGHTKDSTSEHPDESLVSWVSKLLEKCSARIGKNNE